MDIDCIAHTFLSKVKSKIDIPCRAKVNNEVIKLKIYFPEAFDDLDLRILNMIMKEETEQHFSELAELGFDKSFMFIFKVLKITVKWLKL